jgi:hypothetical protein
VLAGHIYRVLAGTTTGSSIQPQTSSAEFPTLRSKRIPDKRSEHPAAAQ